MGIYNPFVCVHPSRGVVLDKSSAHPDHNRDGDKKKSESIAVFHQIAHHIRKRSAQAGLTDTRCA